MRFTETSLGGLVLIEPEPRADERGFFARTWCRREFEAHGLDARVAQCNVSFSLRRGTLRGMHYQAPPHAEAKLVRCAQGAIYDVCLDLRADSPTSGQWQAFELTAENRRMLYVPAGCAHGFLTLSDNAEVYYQVSEYYCPQAERGVRWDDPAFAIAWPMAVEVISAKDRSHPLWPDQQAA